MRQEEECEASGGRSALANSSMGEPVNKVKNMSIVNKKENEGGELYK
jgi:hypothetical protein